MLIVTTTIFHKPMSFIRKLKDKILSIFVTLVLETRIPVYLCWVLAVIFELTNIIYREHNVLLLKSLRRQLKHFSGLEARLGEMNANSEFMSYKRKISQSDAYNESFISNFKLKINIGPEEIEYITLLNCSISYSRLFYSLQQVIIVSAISFYLVRVYYFGIRPTPTYIYLTGLSLSVLIISLGLYYLITIQWVGIEKDHLSAIILENTAILEKLKSLVSSHEIQYQKFLEWDKFLDPVFNSAGNVS